AAACPPRAPCPAGAPAGAPPPRPPRPPRPPELGSIWYATQRESAENAGAVASATCVSWLSLRRTRCMTGFASVGAVFVRDRTYVTHLPSPEIDEPSMPRHLV